MFYKNRQPESVIDAAQQFERENPTHPRVDYTLYMRGMALFAGEKAFIHKLFRVDVSKRQKAAMQLAHRQLSLLVEHRGL